jgi:hypothetical protein
MRQFLIIATFASLASPALVLADATATGTSISLNFNDKCAGGGTRVSTGSYDPATGALNMTETMTACVDPSGGTHDGTVTLSGTVGPASGGSYPMDITYAFNDKYVTSTNNSVQRVCTWEKKGAFDTTTERFQGTIAKTNCSLTVDEKEKGNIIEHILRKATATEN